MTRLRRLRARRAEDGAAAVEFALVAPLLIILVFGIIAFGILFAQKLALGNAARQAARYGVVADRTCADLTAEAKDDSSTIAMDGAQAQVTVTLQSADGTPVASASQPCPGTNPTATTEVCAGSSDGDQVYVEVQYDSTLIIPLVITDNNFEISGDGVFRCEYS